MIRRPTRTTRTDSLVPFTQLFRSCISAAIDAMLMILPLLFCTNGRNALQPLTTPIRLIAICQSQSSSDSRSEEHTSELQSLMRISYAGFYLKKKKITSHKRITEDTIALQKRITTNPILYKL